MPYDWISLLLEAILLLNDVSFAGRFTCDVSPGQEGIYRFTDADTEYHTLSVRAAYTGEVLFSRDILPWTDFGFNLNPGVDMAVLPVRLVNVTDYALVFETPGFIPGQTTGAMPGLTGSARPGQPAGQPGSEFEEALLHLLEYGDNGNLQEEELNLPGGVNEISHRVYNHHVVLQIALPGSRMPAGDEWRHVCSGRMLNLVTVPDRGPVVSRWIRTIPAPGRPAAWEGGVLNIFQRALDNARAQPEERGDIFEDARIELEETLLQHGCFDRITRERYEQRLNLWLSVGSEEPPEVVVPETPTTFPSEEKVFGDYSPKETEDTAFDYLPALSGVTADFSPALPEHLADLVRLFHQYDRKAGAHPGAWEEGNPILGGREREYRPSLEELARAELGSRIRTVVEDLSASELARLLSGQDADTRPITYSEFTFTHLDVLGSGRFFYVETITPVTVSLTGGEEGYADQ